MKSRLRELQSLAEDISAAIDWPEPWQRRTFEDHVTWALKVGHKAINEPCLARTRDYHGDQKIDRVVEVVPYPAWDTTKGGES